MLCGRFSCPMISKAAALSKYSNLIDSNLIDGASPPSVFVGRAGYPKVYAGPMIPPLNGDTSIFDRPESWMGKSIDDLIDFRYALVRGRIRVNAQKPQEFNLLPQLQELAMADKPVDSEALFKRKPDGTIVLSEFSPPFGPSAPLSEFKMGNVSVDARVEKAFYDSDLKASRAIWELYLDETSITKIQRCLSIGMLGIKTSRRLVPTRWSITAVDDTISKNLINQMKCHPTIDEYRVYYFKYLDNRYVVLLSPLGWEFEWIEAWFPGTTWNKEGVTPEIMGDHEGYKGRTTYAEIGGCYYSARLAVAEALIKERKQASSLALREIHPGYTLPVGVWNVRESLRVTMKKKPEIFDNHVDAIKYAMNKLTIPLNSWIWESEILKGITRQTRLEKYFKRRLNAVHNRSRV